MLMQLPLLVSEAVIGLTPNIKVASGAQVTDSADQTTLGR
jgi:hypothetical protein